MVSDYQPQSPAVFASGGIVGYSCTSPMTDALYQPFPMQGRNRGQIWRYAPQYRRPRHFHPEPELNLVCAGTGAFGTGDRRISVSAGDLIGWAPGVDHELLEASLDFDVFVIGATAEFSERVLGSSGLHQVVTRSVRVSSSTLARLQAACALPVAELEPVVLERRVAELWREAHGFKNEPDMHTLTLRSMRRLAHEHELSRSELARSFRAYPSEISRYFRRDTGITLLQYRTRLRIMRFIAAADAGTNLLAAANAAGFGSYSQCHRAFRSALGCSPREFFGSRLRREMSEAFVPLVAHGER
jgi:AraC-like DNA-binding protein/mannose-6-phosphate isomerase-like protein (cupin superfamily)